MVRGTFNFNILCYKNCKSKDASMGCGTQMHFPELIYLKITVKEYLKNNGQNIFEK